MGTNQNITVEIAGRPYRMAVDRNKEEVVRKAAGVLNDAIKAYADSFEFKDNQDLFAMVALQHVANSIHLENEKSFRESELENELLKIDELLSSELE